MFPYGGYVSGFGDQLEQEIRRLETAGGEIDNVVKAALHTVALDFSSIVSDPSVWPVYATDGNMNVSQRKSKYVPEYATTPVRLGLPHSINNWQVNPDNNGWTVSNPNPYVTFIHDNKPSGNLLRAVVEPLLAEIEAAGLDAVEGAVLKLFVGG